MLVESNLLAQEFSSFLSSFALTSLKNTFFLTSGLLSFLVNSTYSSLV